MKKRYQYWSSDGIKWTEWFDWSSKNYFPQWQLKNKLLNQNLIYDNLIFEILKKEETEDLKEQVRKANLNDVDLKRLAASLSSIAENKINDFQKNNREFKENNITYWNYKYDIIAKSYAKTRELETFILSIIAGD